MAENEGDQQQEKYDFTAEGEAPEWIGLDQARIQAIEHARDHTEFYGPGYDGIQFVYQVASAEESEDYYDIKLSFRPAGLFRLLMPSSSLWPAPLPSGSGLKMR